NVSVREVGAGGKATLAVNTGAGNDAATLALGEIEAGGTLTATFNLGAGDDTMVLRAEEDTGEEGTIAISLNGGDNTDPVRGVEVSAALASHLTITTFETVSGIPSGGDKDGDDQGDDDDDDGDEDED